jgi:hypothetical protein
VAIIRRYEKWVPRCYHLQGSELVILGATLTELPARDSTDGKDALLQIFLAMATAPVEFGKH